MRWMLIGCCLVMLYGAGTVRAEDELVVVSPHWEGVRFEFGEAFRRLYREETGRNVDLKWLDVGGGSDILKYLRSEFKNKPEGIGVDLFFGGGTDPYRELKKLGILVPYRVPEEVLQTLAPSVGGVPMYDPDYTWYAATMAGFGIIYNRVVLERLGLPEPRTWEDLTRPEMLSWVGSADPRKSGSVHMAYEIILQAYGWTRGWEIVTALGANVRGFSSAGAQTPKDVALGEVACGLAIDSYAWAQVREVGEEMIGYVMPEDLTVVNGDAIALLKGGPNRTVAERFVRFVLSEEGQKLWILHRGEPDGPRKFELEKFSVLPGLYRAIEGRTSVKLNPFAWRSDFVYDAEKGSARWSIVNDLIGSMIVDPHRRLSAFWKRALDAGMTREELRERARAPITEEEVEQLVEEGRWSDAAFRNQTMTAWAAMARQRYGTGGRWGNILRNLPAIATAILAVVTVVYMRRRSSR